MSEASKHQRYSAGALSACCNACDATCCPSGTCASIAERSSKSTKNTNPRSAMSLRPSPLHLGSALRILWSWWCDPKAPNCWPRPHHSSLFEMYWALCLSLVATRSSGDCVEQTGRTPTRTSTRPPHLLHPAPCPYRTLGRKHLNGYDSPIRSSTFIRCAVSVYDTLDILLKCI